MRWFLNRCERHRRSICLLASGALRGPESDAIESHLAACVDCRKYYRELKAMTAPLTNWEGNFIHLQPGENTRNRWAEAIQAASGPEPVCRVAPAEAILEWCHDMIWPCRRLWAGLATVWVVIFLANLSLHERMPIGAKSGASSEMTMTLKDQQKILAELLTDHSAPTDADRQRIFLPKPRTERVELLTV